jgi:hypothetical protein
VDFVIPVIFVPLDISQKKKRSTVTVAPAFRMI